MYKPRAGKNDWTLADAAVDTQWLINCWDAMSDKDKLDAMHNLMDRLREGIEHEGLLKDAQGRINKLRKEGRLDGSTPCTQIPYAIRRH